MTVTDTVLCEENKEEILPGRSGKPSHKVAFKQKEVY